MTTGQRAHQIAGELLSQLAGADTAVGPMLKMAKAAGLTRRLAATFPPVDDEAAWVEMCEHFAGILLALTEHNYGRALETDADAVPIEHLELLLARGRETVAALLEGPL